MDPIDFKIVQELDSNSRDSFSKIAHACGIAPRTVHRRVVNMQRSGFIRSFDTILEPSTLDFGEAICDVQIQLSATSEEVRNRIQKLPNVNEIITLVGGTSVVYVYYRNPAELESVLAQISETPGVADVQYELSPRAEEQSNKLSRQSWLLVRSLNHNSRRELVSIAREAGLSPRTVQRQIRWLQSTHAVRFGVDIDVSKAADLLIYVLVVRLQLGIAKHKILEQLRREIPTVWRELRTVNPHSIIVLLYARRTSELERDVEKARLVKSVAGIRLLIVTGDRENTSLVDSRIAEKANERSIRPRQSQA